MDQYVSVNDRDLEAVKHATGKRSARTAVRAALLFTAKYCKAEKLAPGRGDKRRAPARSLHPDTLKSVKDFSAGRFTRHATARESLTALRGQIAAKAKTKAA